MEFEYLVTRTTKEGTKVFQSLGTTDERAAQALWRVVHDRVERIFKEAEAGVKSPEVAAYKAVQGWKQSDVPEREEALDYHLTSLLEDGGSIRRRTVEAPIKRQKNGGADNPPLSIIFGRYYAERKLPAKTRMEWDLCLSRIQAVCGGDVAVRSVTQAHVRGLKDSLLSTPARRGGGTLSPATVKKCSKPMRGARSAAPS